MRKKLKLHLRVEEENSTHVHFTVFANGANAGTLCLTSEEWTQFVEQLSLGKRENEFMVTKQPRLFT